jgi:hypothetical protein
MISAPSSGGIFDPNAKIPICNANGCYYPGEPGSPSRPPPTCASVKNTANTLKAIGWGGGIWAGLGKLGVVAESDGTALGVFAISGGVGGLLGLTAEYHLSCTP